MNFAALFDFPKMLMLTPELMIIQKRVIAIFEQKTTGVSFFQGFLHDPLAESVDLG